MVHGPEDHLVKSNKKIFPREGGGFNRAEIEGRLLMG